LRTAGPFFYLGPNSFDLNPQIIDKPANASLIITSSKKIQSCSAGRFARKET